MILLGGNSQLGVGGAETLAPGQAGLGFDVTMRGIADWVSWEESIGELELISHIPNKSGYGFNVGFVPPELEVGVNCSKSTPLGKFGRDFSTIAIRTAPSEGALLCTFPLLSETVLMDVLPAKPAGLHDALLRMIFSFWVGVKAEGLRRNTGKEGPLDEVMSGCLPEIW